MLNGINSKFMNDGKKTFLLEELWEKVGENY